MAQYASPTVASLCSSGPRPQLLTRAVVHWLRAHFADAANLEDRELARENTRFVWRPGPVTSPDAPAGREHGNSGIAIDAIGLFDPCKIGSRPALIVKRNAWAPQRRGVDNRMMGGLAPDGSRAYAHFWQGSHTVFCLAGLAAECEKLADEVRRELGQFAPAMRGPLGLMRLEVAGLGDAAALLESRQHFVIPATLAYAFEDTWRLRPRTPQLARLVMTVLAGGD